MNSRGCLALLLAVGCATPPPPVPTTGPAESADDLAIEAELPGIEAAARRGQGLEALDRFVTRADHAGKVLAAWSDPDLQAAWNKFHALSDFNHVDVWADIGIGHVYLEWKTLDQAAGALDRALVRNDHIAELHVLRAQLARLQGRFADALSEAQRAVDLHPGDSFALDELGLAAQQQGNAAAARERFEAARKAWPDDYVAVRGLADLDTGDPKAELADLDDLHRLAPQELSLWLESGRMRERAGDFTGAARDFEGALKRGAHDPDLLKLLAKTYREQGREADEKVVLADLVSQKVGGQADGDGLRRLAELEAKGGDSAAAMRDYKLAIAANPGDMDSQLALARLAVTSGTLMAAIGAFRAVVEAKPEAKAELDGLEAQAHLSKAPIEGSVVKINAQLGVQLNKLYRSLLNAKPGLGGELRLRVVVKADGSIAQEELLEDSVGDPALAANLYWNAHDAHFPRGDAKYLFKFNLTP